MSFVGSFKHSLDAKKRVFIPAKFREELGEEFYITRKFDTYLSIYTAEDWEKAQVEFEVITAQMKLHNYTDEQLREIGKLKGKCSAYLSKGVFKKLEKGLIELGGAMEGFFEGLEQIVPKNDSISNQ